MAQGGGATGREELGTVGVQPSSQKSLGPLCLCSSCTTVLHSLVTAKESSTHNHSPQRAACLATCLQKVVVAVAQTTMHSTAKLENTVEQSRS